MQLICYFGGALGVDHPSGTYSGVRRSVPPTKLTGWAARWKFPPKVGEHVNGWLVHARPPAVFCWSIYSVTAGGPQSIRGTACSPAILANMFACPGTVAE